MTTTAAAKKPAAAAAPKSPKKVVVKKKTQRTKVAPSSPRHKRKKPVTGTATAATAKAVAESPKKGSTKNNSNNKNTSKTPAKSSLSSSYPPIYQLQIDTDEIFKTLGSKKASSTPSTVFFDKLKQRYKSKTVLGDDQKAAVKDRLQYLTERQDDVIVDGEDGEDSDGVLPMLDTPWPDEKIVAAVDDLYHSTEDINQIRVKHFCRNLHQKYHFFMPESTKKLIKKRLKDLALGQVVGDNNNNNNKITEETTATEGSLDALGEPPVTATVDKKQVDKKNAPSKSPKKTSGQTSIGTDSQGSKEKEKDDDMKGKNVRSKKTVATTANSSDAVQAKVDSYEEEAKAEDDGDGDGDGDEDDDMGEGPMLSTLKKKTTRETSRAFKANAEEKRKQEEKSPRKRTTSISEAKEDDDDAYGEDPVLSSLKKKRTSSSVSRTDNDDGKDDPSREIEDRHPKKRSRKDSTSSSATSKSKPSMTKTVAKATGSAAAAASVSATASTGTAITTTAASSGNATNEQHIGNLIASLRRDLEKDKKVRSERLRKAKMHAQAAKMSYENCLSVIEEMEKDDDEHSRRIQSTMAMLIQEQNKT